MKITIQKFKVKGYIGFPRFLIQDLKDRKLKIESMGLLMVMVGLAEWDERHDNYGKLCINNSQLGLLTGVNRNTIRKIKTELITGGYIQLSGKDDGCDVISIIDFENYQKRKKQQPKEDEISLEEIEKLMKDVDIERAPPAI